MVKKDTWNDFYFLKYVKINLWLDVIKPMDVPCVLRENVQQMGGKLGVFIRLISLIIYVSCFFTDFVWMFLPLLKVEYGIYYHRIAINFKS